MSILSSRLPPGASRWPFASRCMAKVSKCRDFCKRGAPAKQASLNIALQGNLQAGRVVLWQSYWKTGAPVADAMALPHESSPMIPYEYIARISCPMVSTEHIEYPPPYQA